MTAGLAPTGLDILNAILNQNLLSYKSTKQATSLADFP